MCVMKKYVYLVLSTVMLIALIVMSGFIADGQIVTVETYPVHPETEESIITVNGKIEYNSEKSIRNEGAGIINEINVGSGDRVEQGDLLFSYYALGSSYEAMLSDYADIEHLGILLGNMENKEIPDDIISEAKKYAELICVYSDYSGTVIDIAYKADEVISKNTEVMKVSNTEQYNIPAAVNETVIEKIKTGQRVTVRLSAIKDRRFSGKVTSIADAAEQTTGLTGKETTVKVTISLDDDLGEKLRPGYSAECSIITSVDDGVLVIPYDDIHTDDEGDYVFIVRNQTAKKVYIKTGREYKNGAEVISGLHENDRIITNADTLSDGQTIRLSTENHHA